MEQDTCTYKFRYWLSTSWPFKYLCCCFRVKDRLNVPWDEMDDRQRRYRVKSLWNQARLIYHYFRLRNMAVLQNAERRKQ